jgi:D-galactose 1-dehydrogenase
VTNPIRLAIIGLGKIAHDQHLPAIAANPDLDLVATVSHHSEGVEGIASFRDIAGLAASGIAVDAVTLCTPPQVRRAIAAFAIDRGWHVFLEKPPGATLAEVVTLRDQAHAQHVSLFTSWHSRFAAGVEPARAWLADRIIRHATITWREDVRHWHPGQDWIFEAGGFGVFDPGINALSIATHILPRPFFVEAAAIDIPGNRAAPITARVDFRDTSGAPIAMDLDFRQQGTQRWDIAVDTDAGVLTLANGGAMLTVAGAAAPAPTDELLGEYPGLYRRFVALVRAGVSDVDVGPLRLVADSFLRARITTVDDFHW